MEVEYGHDGRRQHLGRPGLRGPGRPRPSGDHRSPEPGAGDGERDRRAVRDLPPGGLEAHPGPRARGPGHPHPGGTAPPGAPQPPGPRGPHRVDRRLPPRPRTAVPPARRPPAWVGRDHHRPGVTMTNSLHLDIPAGVPWIDFTREFDAPVAAVFEAHRDPELVSQWLGPNGYAMEVERWDFVSCVGYRYIHRNPEGAEFGFHGTFHTVRENEFAVQTFEFEGATDEVALEFMRFVDLGNGRCRLEGRSIGRTVES